MIEVKCNGDLVVNRRSLVYAPVRPDFINLVRTCWVIG